SLHLYSMVSNTSAMSDLSFSGTLQGILGIRPLGIPSGELLMLLSAPWWRASQWVAFLRFSSTILSALAVGSLFGVLRDLRPRVSMMLVGFFDIWYGVILDVFVLVLPLVFGLPLVRVW
ncbi:unnamed protein product, partial [Owenia fusiformis]